MSSILAKIRKKYYLCGETTNDAMTTIKAIAPTKGVTPDTLRRKVEGVTGRKFTINDELPTEVIQAIEAMNFRPQKNGRKRKAAVKPKKIQQPIHSTKPSEEPARITRVLAILPLPMLGLAASYGVYFFAAFFVPDFVAIAEAAAFELTYIGLAMVTGLDDTQQKRASIVAKAAVWVSVVYNTLAGVMHQQPAWFEDMHPAAVWALAIVHGVPLALLAYQVANLLLHRKA